MAILRTGLKPGQVEDFIDHRLTFSLLVGKLHWWNEWMETEIRATHALRSGPQRSVRRTLPGAFTSPSTTARLAPAEVAGEARRVNLVVQSGWTPACAGVTTTESCIYTSSPINSFWFTN